MSHKPAKDETNWIMSDLTCRVVAKSGIPTDRYHLGKLILQSLKDHPGAILQIDGATGESDTNASMLKKSVKCATCFHKLGLCPGDVIVLMAPNHLNLTVPLYAAMYTGIIISALDRNLGIEELRTVFKNIAPKMIFCQSEKAHDVQVALNGMEYDAKIVTFDKREYFCSFSEFIKKYEDNMPVEDFKATDFDAENTTAFLISTSGTTGLPKVAETLHKNFAIAMPVLCSQDELTHPTAKMLIASPSQWLTTLLHFISSAIFKYTRLQSSMNFTQKHACYLINTYKPRYTILNPTFITTLANGKGRNFCDFSCFDTIWLAGSAASKAIMDEVKMLYPKIMLVNIYGMSEINNLAFHGSHVKPDSCGVPAGCHQYRIINTETLEDINEPNVPGELWLRGPCIFKGYYKNSEATEQVFAEDGWFKTGDLFYRDEHWHFFFIERIKFLLKYKNNQISPVEVENVIRKHPGVLDVAVTGVPEPECGDLPVACVVKREGWDVTADDIKLLVKDSLSDAKQLRGGVIFINKIPTTAASKVQRKMLKEMVLTMERH